VEATFRQMPGVLGTRVGYTGGQTDNPTYKDVCTDRTGHAEAVEVEFDPAQIRYDDLLKVFWEKPRPHSAQPPGPGLGHAIPLRIFFHTPQQQTAAQASKEALEKAHRYSKPIATQIVPAVTFFPAETTTSSIWRSAVWQAATSRADRLSRSKKKSRTNPAM